MRLLWPVAALLVSIWALGAATAHATEAAFSEGGAAECTLTFDDVCPDTARVCSTRFRGGDGCVVDGLPFCYDSGILSYKVAAGDRSVIRFGAGVSEVEVFFAQAADGTPGQMTFFDANGLQVGPAIATNGNCSEVMPATQTLTFERPVIRVRVQAFDTDVYLDSLRLVRD